MKKKASGSHDERENKLKKESPVTSNTNLIREQHFHILSTQGDSSSNGTGVGDRRGSDNKKVKSASISSGSAERKPHKKAGGKLIFKSLNTL